MADTLNRETLGHLLLSFPEQSVQHDGTGVIDTLVEGAICQLLGTQGITGVLIVRDVIREIQRLAGLNYETSEIVSSLERLSEHFDISFNNKEHTAFVYPEDRVLQVTSIVSNRKTNQDLVRDTWLREVRQRHSIAGDEAAELWVGLENFVARIVHKHAAEAAAFLHMVDDAGQVAFYNVLSRHQGQIGDFVDPALEPIAEVEFQRFLLEASGPKVDYLGHRLRAAFFFHLLSIDPTASQFVRQGVAGKTLYLDTNFVFRLLGLQGPLLAYGPGAVVTFAKELECELLVAQESVNEFILALKTETAKLRQYPITGGVYRRLAAEFKTDEWDFMQAFYRDIQSGRVASVDEFERKYSNVEGFLDSWGISIDEDAVLTDEERSDTKFQERFSALNLWHNQQKHPALIEHDVFLERMIRRKRGDFDASPTKTKCWLLTYDRRLNHFAVYHASSTHLPFTLFADDWLQISRPFLPRTPDYEASFVGMLRNPLMFGSAGGIPFEHVTSALHRLERYEELPARVVAAMLADGEFLRRFHSVEDAADERELLRTGLEEATRKIAGETEERERQLTEALTANEQLETRLLDAHDEIETVRKERDVARDQRAEVEAQLDKRNVEVEETTTHYAAEVKGLRDELRRALRWVVYFALATPVIAAGVGFTAWQWDALSPIQRGISIAWTLGVLLLLLGVPLGKKGRVVFALFATVAGLVAASLQLWNG